MKNNQGRATQEAQETFVDIRYLVASCFVGEQGNPRTLQIFHVERTWMRMMRMRMMLTMMRMMKMVG